MIISIAPPPAIIKLKSYIKWVEHHNLDWKILTEDDNKIEGALLLCGGADVGTVPDRDKFEKSLIDQALENDLPILGICRGMQIVNWHLGGVVEDVWNEGFHAISEGFAGDDSKNRESIYHLVTSKTDAMRFEVNSRHHQHCSILAAELSPLLWTEDETIECAIGRKIMLVQWHPEREEIWDNHWASEWPIGWIKTKIKSNI